MQMQISDEHNSGAVPSPQPNEDSSQKNKRSFTSLLHTAEGPLADDVKSDIRLGQAALPAQAPVSRFDCADRWPGSLHLTPCTVEQFLDLGFDREDRYELVEGVLVSYPPIPMADDEHGRIIDHLNGLFGYIPGLEVRVSTQLPVHVDAAKGKRTRHHDSSPSAASGQSSSSNDSSRVQETATLRYPDIFIFEKSADSENSDLTLSPSRGRRQPTKKSAIMVIEVTSTNRRTDLEEKRREYEKQNIAEYVVIDRQKGCKSPHPCVMVYRLNGRGKYEVETYRGKQEVQCSFLQRFRLTAGHMLDHKRLREIYGRERKKWEESVEEAEKTKEENEGLRATLKATKEEAEKTKKEAEKTKKEAEKTKKEAGKTKKEAEKTQEENKRLKAQLRHHGIDIAQSSGSSSANSPVSPNDRQRKALKLPEDHNNPEARKHPKARKHPETPKHHKAPKKHPEARKDPKAAKTGRE